MKKCKLKTIDIRFFLIPFFTLFFLFAAISYKSVDSHIKNTYAMIERHSLDIAKVYARRIINSNFSTEIITGLIDEKLLLANEAVMQLEDMEDTKILPGLAKKYFVDEITIYNKFGEAINSTAERMAGWKAYEGHPVYEFMMGDRDTLIEDIRANTETGIFYKYAYTRKKDGSFIQIGVLADKVSRFLHRFEIQQLIEDFMVNENVDNIFFTNTDYELIASSTEKHAGITFDKEDIHKHFLSDEAKTGRDFVDGDSTLYVSAPVFHNEERIGTLIVVWSPQIIDAEVKEIIADNVFRFIIVLVIFGSVLHYAYSENKSNIKIAFYDKLTGLPNDEYLKEYLAQKIKDCAGNKIAVLLLNCTNFSLINLTYGFEYGDNILRQVAKSLSNNLSAKDMLFRLDADKFVMIINGYEKMDELNSISQLMIEGFKKPFFDMHKHEYLNLKIAIYELWDKDISADQVLRNVSLGVAALKNDSNKNYIVYNREMKDGLTREELIEKALITIISGEFKDFLYMVYQPLFDIRSNKIVGFEALVRMTIQDIGRVPPLEFIGLAEKRNLIFSLGNIILKEITEFLYLLKNSGYADIFVTTNISGLQLLRDGFIDVVRETVGLSQEDWKRLIFEITESVLVDNYKLINERLAEIKSMGSLVALDDFGTGYSSLTGLRDLNIDIIKIDRSFVERIKQYSEDTLITQDIITMSHKLGLRVVAEGVENEQQMNYLKDHNCDIIQGFYLSRPLAKFDAIEFLKNYNT